MTLKQCIFIASRCYKSNRKMRYNKPEGIVVHSTGANNPNLKRYVQPAQGQSNYNEIIKDLGVNYYGNHLNQYGPEVCVHAFIGKNQAGKVETYQTLPFNICCWGIAAGSKGSFNYAPAKLQFEICEDGLNDKAYFDAAFKEAIEFSAEICKTYNLSVDTITSHKESHALGYGSNHGDPEHWMTKYGKDMNWFRKEVQKLLDAENKPVENKPIESGIKAGNLVKIASEATYYTGAKIPAWVTNQKWYVKSISGDRAVIDKSEDGKNSICSPVNVKFLTVVSNDALKVGDTVKLAAGAPIYGTNRTFASWVYNTKLYVREISDNKIIISTLKTGDITGAVDKKYLKKV